LKKVASDPEYIIHFLSWANILFWQAADTQAASATQNALDTLFGDAGPEEAGTSTADSHRTELDALFGKDEPDKP